MWQGTNSRNIINRINILKVDICSLLGFCFLFWLKMPFFFFLLICFVKICQFYWVKGTKHSLPQSTIRGCRCSLWELLHLCHCGYRFRKHYLFPFRDQTFPTASRTETHTYLITNLILLPACLFSYSLWSCSCLNLWPYENRLQA